MPFRDGFPIFHTADLERLTVFYVDVIGCEVAYRFEDAYVGLTGPVTLGFATVRELEPAGRASLWLYCDDVDAEVQRLRAAGAEIVSEPEDRGWGERMAMVHGPDGNVISIGAQ